MTNNNFCIFILTHGRPDNVITYHTLLRMGCKDPIYFVIDNEDETAERYYENFGEENVIMFDKKAVSETFDEADNFNDRRAIVYARNACFDIAKNLGYKYFLELDDDYGEFKYRINHKYEHPQKYFTVKNNLSAVFHCTLEYFKNIKVESIAFSQGGDWFGGGNNFGKFKRKAMNSFFCSIDRPFQFVGRINEDVNTYTCKGSRGELFFSLPFIQLDQLQTQTNIGGMTDIYIDSGTYIKSFYTVMMMPSCVKVGAIGKTSRRLHHKINWNNTCPKILDESYKKVADA